MPPDDIAHESHPWEGLQDSVFKLLLCFLSLSLLQELERTMLQPRPKLRQPG